MKMNCFLTSSSANPTPILVKKGMSRYPVISWAALTRKPPPVTDGSLGKLSARTCHCSVKEYTTFWDFYLRGQVYEWKIHVVLVLVLVILVTI